MSRRDAYWQKVLQVVPASDSAADVAQAIRSSVAPELVGALRYLSQTYARCDDVSAPPDLRESVGPLKAALVGEAVQTLQKHGAGSAERFVTAVMDRTLSRKLLVRVLDQLADQAPDLADALCGPLMQQYATRIKGRSYVDMKSDEVGAMAALAGGKSAGEKLCARNLASCDAFLPQRQTPCPLKAKDGHFIQCESLLGCILGANPFDIYGYNAQQRTQAPMHVHFKILRKTERDLAAAQESLRQSTMGMVEQNVTLVNALIRAGPVARENVLKWFGTLLTTSEGRAQMGSKLPPTGHLVDMLTHQECPALQTLGGHMSMYTLMNRMKGYPSSGAGIMVSWALLRLSDPIKLDQAGALDPFLMHREDCATLVGGMKEWAILGEKDEADKSLAANAEAMKAKLDFKSQVFWLTHKAIHVMLLPAMKEAETAFGAAGSFMHSSERKRADDAYAHWLCAEVVFHCRAFEELLARYLNLTMAFVLACAYPEAKGDLLGKLKEGKLRVPPAQMSDTYVALPESFLEDVFEVIDFYRHVSYSRRQKEDFTGFLEPEVLIAFLMFVMGSGQHIRNPNTRGNAAKIIHDLTTPRQNAIIREWPMSVANMVPACIEVFSAVEKTKMSYYDIRFHIKYELRIPIMDLFQRLLPLDAHRQGFKDFVTANPEPFLKFINQLLNDSTYLLDEGIDTLLEIRRRAATGEDQNDDPRATQSGSAGLGVQRGIEEEDRTEEGEDIYRRSRHDPKQHCSKYMDLGHRTVKTLYMMALEAPSVLVSKEVVLQQITQNFLDSNLNRLVGPKCLQLKGQTKDFETYNFDPKTLLAQICTVYTVLLREAKTKTMKFISEDQRYYSADTFKKAVRIVTRERMLSGEMLESFTQLVNELAAFATDQQAAQDVEIPDEFLDPIMSDMMTDPVLLPGSKYIMDRKHITRIIMSDDHDPFTRQPLKMEELIPQDELKERIHKFAAEHRIVLGDDE